MTGKPLGSSCRRLPGLCQLHSLDVLITGGITQSVAMCRSRNIKKFHLIGMEVVDLVVEA